MNKFILLLIAYSSLLIAVSSCHADNYPMQEVAPDVFYHQGVDEDATEKNIGAIANVGFIIGEKCVAVIDSGGSYLEGEYLRNEVRKKTTLPICYVINTHVHPDHLLGNAAFKQDNPIFIGHEKLPAAIAARQVFFSKTFKKLLGKAYIGTEFIPPTKTVSINAPIMLDLGDRTLTLTAYSTSHTDNDLTVLDNKTNTLWTGDLLFIGRTPVMDGSINGWIRTMEQLQSQSFSLVIPGHGKATTHEWKQALASQLHYFKLIRKQIRVIINNLGTIKEATETVGLSEEKNWELFPEYHRRNVTASFVELEWE